MEYRELVADFATRTLRNLDLIQARVLLDEDVYPVTQLWNSLLGLIVLPHERELRRIPERPMTELWSEGWPRVTAPESRTEHETLHELLRDLRNAVAHFNVDFEVGLNREITSVTVWTQPLGTDRASRSSRRWEGRMTVTELESLARLIADVYLREFAASPR